MSLIRLYDVSKKYDTKQVFREVFFRLEAGDRVGLIGKNGVGKTTILRLILGQEEPTSGQIELEENIRLGYFSQFSELSEDTSIQNILTASFTSIHALEKALREVETALEESLPEDVLNRLLTRYDKLLEQMERRGGWTYQNRIDTVLTKLGFTEQDRHRCAWKKISSSGTASSSAPAPAPLSIRRP